MVAMVAMVAMCSTSVYLRQGRLLLPSSTSEMLLSMYRAVFEHLGGGLKATGSKRLVVVWVGEEAW